MPNAQRLCQVPQGIVKFFAKLFYKKAGFFGYFFYTKKVTQQLTP